MPNNHAERKREINNKYKRVIWGNEYKITHAIGAIADCFLTGGTFTIAKVRKDFAKLGLSVATTWIKDCGMKPNVHCVCGYMTVSQWEQPWTKKPWPLKGKWKLPKIQLPNSFVVYVAFCKK